MRKLTNIELFLEYQKDNDVLFNEIFVPKEILYCTHMSCFRCTLNERICNEDVMTHFPHLTLEEFEQLKSITPEYFI